MKFHEYFIKTMNPNLRIYCHSINVKIEKRFGIKLGTFILQTGGGIIIRIKDKDLSLFLENITKLTEILDNNDQLFKIGEINLKEKYHNLSLIMNYGKDNEEKNLPKFSLLNNSLVYSSSKKSILKGVNIKSTNVNPIILQKKPFLKTEMVIYSFNGKEKRIPIQEIKVDFNEVTIENYNEFYEQVVLGVGEKKSYGCGLIIL